jgi:hypothetical protein
MKTKKCVSSKKSVTIRLDPHVHKSLRYAAKELAECASAVLMASDQGAIPRR